MRVFHSLILFPIFLSSCNGHTQTGISEKLIIDTTYVGKLSNGDIYKLIISKDSNAIFRYNDTNFRYYSIKMGHLIKKRNDLYTFLCKKAIGLSIGKSFTYGDKNLSIRLDSTSITYLNSAPLILKYNGKDSLCGIFMNEKEININMASHSCKNKSDLIDLYFNLNGFGLNENVQLRLNYIHTGVLIDSRTDSFDFRITNDSLITYKTYIDLPPPHNVDTMIIILKNSGS